MQFSYIRKLQRQNAVKQLNKDIFCNRKCKQFAKAVIIRNVF